MAQYSENIFSDSMYGVSVLNQLNIPVRGLGSISQITERIMEFFCGGIIC